MKKFFFYIFSILVVAFLVGCDTLPIKKDPAAPTIVTKTELKVIRAPKELITSCKATAPPERQEYATADAATKEAKLIAYSGELITIIKNCDKTITAIDKWGDDQEKLLLNPSPSQ